MKKVIIVNRNTSTTPEKLVLEDDSIMAFGTDHKGKRLIDVPYWYLLWLRDQDWFKGSTDVFKSALRVYIEENLDVLQQEETQANQKRRI